jgi:hypothetical protein
MLAYERQNIIPDRRCTSVTGSRKFQVRECCTPADQLHCGPQKKYRRRGGTVTSHYRSGHVHLNLRLELFVHKHKVMQSMPAAAREKNQTPENHEGDNVR